MHCRKQTALPRCFLANGARQNMEQFHLRNCRLPECCPSTFGASALCLAHKLWHSQT